MYVVLLSRGGDRTDLPVEVGLPRGELSSARHVVAALREAARLRPEARIIGSY